jgi:diguanylate cyclase (GGDEF)-like protein
VNDQRGHEVGDQALALFARLLREQLREGDLCGRLGGEEFAVALNQGGVAAAQALDQRLRQALRQRSPVELGFELGYSAGAARLQAEDRSMRELLSRADQALYRAKAGGRGRLLLSPDVA